MEEIRSLFLFFVITFCLSLTSALSAGDQLSADKLFTHAKIYTANPTQPEATAVAIKEGKIVYVGNDDEAMSWKGKHTQHTLLNGKRVFPGLIDSHTHPGLVSLLASVTPIPDNLSHQELLDWLEAFARDNPELPYILAGSWNIQNYGIEGPHRSELDKIVNDRPVILIENWGHSFWVNSKAFEDMGVDHATEDPIPGLSTFKRDDKGELTGWIKEFAAVNYLSKLIKPGQQFETVLDYFIQHLSSSGVTSIFDAGNLGFHDEVFSVVHKMDQEGRLPLRYEGAYHVFLPELLEQAIPELKRLREKYKSENLHFNTVKIHFDGITEIRTASMLNDYSDDPGNRGGVLFSEERLTNFIRKLNAAKLDLHMHTIGDNATKTALNAYETVSNELNGEIHTRMTLCHLDVVDDKDIQRFAKLGVVANFTPHWHGASSEHLHQVLGERSKHLFRVTPFLDTNAKVTFSSDVISPAEWERASPWVGIQIGHTRQELGMDKNDPILLPLNERLSLQTLMNGYTKEGAYQLRGENEIGSIEVGKNADLIIMNDDIFDMKPNELHSAKVAMTIKEGEVVFERTLWVNMQEWFFDLIY